ncbi:hypothetical protein JCGZ_11441 [Jatropha curcas]|uniref:Apyrase 7 n=1 Tax=Jatropha curcas TaxID=180498 RepID=A0A067KFM7_JATCU|nr:probable apyrase 7 [Jatropha curcas]XP_012080020.1 probable apyrase 7 [Jatropha curcas]KDP31065.1 hypothetical protein JCGZ_11441 [Jatropha curcas]
MESKSPSKVKLPIMGFARYKRVLRICAAIVVILLLLVAGYFAFEYRRPRDLAKRDYFTVVVDCGSTGTRVNVYKWKIRSSSCNWDLPILEHTYPDNSTESLFSGSSCKYHCMQTEPGLDKFAGNSTGVRVSLEPLILWAEQWVPRDRHGDTPIFVLATAGLRKLPVEDVRLVLDDVESILKERSFVYRRSWIRVLSGKEEAYYGWVALNYKMGKLGNSSQGSTLGLLDLGGSSLQVVMEVHGEERDNIHLIRTKIGSVERQILAHSLQSFGLNEAFDGTVAKLSQLQLIIGSNDEISKVRHPCLGSDFMQNYTCNACNGHNISHRKNMSGQMHKSEYTSLVGDPDWEQCIRIARAAAINSSSSDTSHPTVSNNCKASLSFNSGSGFLNLTAGAYPTRRFHALSGFFAVTNILDLGPRANLTKIWEKGEQLCSKSSGELSKISEKQNYFRQYCFRLPYMASLIEDALCLGNKEIIFGPGDLSWTLGAALVEGEYLWLSTSKTSISSLTSMEVIYSPIFVSLLLLFLLFIAYHSQIKLPMIGKKGPAITSLPSYLYPKHRPN